MKIKYILSVLTICTAIAGCSSFLDEENISGQPAEKYYQTKAGYEALITGAYSTMKSVYNNSDYFKLTQLGTDIVTQGNGNGTDDLNQSTVNYAADNGTVYNHWKNLYTALKNVNAAIGRAPFVITTDADPLEGMDPTVLAQRVAEAKFLRALYLFEIVQNWGQGPLILEEPTSASTTSQFNSGAEFYAQILADLQDVISSALPEKQGTANYGRASKAAAKHLRALVYLTRGYQSYAESSDFANAYKDAVDVINNSGHKLLDDFALVHRQKNETNDEIVFALNFANATNYNSNIQLGFFLFPYREGWSELGFSSQYGGDLSNMPTKYVYLLFDWKKDRRTEVTFMSPLNGDPATSVEGTNRGKNWFENTNNWGKQDTAIYFPVPIEPTYKVYTDADKTAAIDNRGYVLYNYPQGSIAAASYSDASKDDYYLTSYQSGNGNSRAWLPVWKFKDADFTYTSTNNSNGGTRDRYLFRLAETYLIAAEAALKSNDNANALKYLQAVRNRAAYNAPEAGLPAYSGTVTIDDILDERALELYGEASRWNDLQRTGKLAERALKYNWDITHIYGGLIQTQLSSSPFESKDRWRPIPVTWLNTLSNGQELGNNPGW
jgi:hypothetical protein